VFFKPPACLNSGSRRQGSGPATPSVLAASHRVESSAVTSLLEDRLIRVINAVLVVVRRLRRPRAGQPREWVVVPARAPIVPRVVVRIRLVVTGVEHAVAVDVPVVVVVALPERAGCGNGDCGD
jgi:hypothetical protein